MMAGSIFHLLEVIYAKNVACEVQKICNERCCGCKVYEEDCLMMDEHETWEMHGLIAIEQANNTSSTWNKFMAAIKILNVENHKDFTQHLMCLQEEPDQNFVYTLLRVYQDNQPLLRILHDLWLHLLCQRDKGNIQISRNGSQESV
jgi:hypothetical protein